MAKKEIRRAARQSGLQPKKPVDPRMLDFVAPWFREYC